MFNKLMLVSFLGLSMVATLETEAFGQRYTGGSYTSVNSIEGEAILKDLKNATNITDPAYEAILFLQEVSIRCKNPAGQSQVANNGQPFELNNVTVGDNQTTQDFQITKNGKALLDIFFSNAELFAAVSSSLGQVCNNNWTPDKIVVNRMQAWGTVFSCNPLDANDQNNPRNFLSCDITDAIVQQASLPTGQDLFNSTVDYNLVTLCHDTNDANFGDCPQPPFEIDPPEVILP